MTKCTPHHCACDCREAKTASDMAILRDENSRLRAALEKIISLQDHGKSCLSDGHIGHAVVIAKAALAGEVNTGDDVK